jgi:hypothetical protein
VVRCEDAKSDEGEAIGKAGVTTPAARRARAMHIREAALGFNDDIARTLNELAEHLEAEAAELEAKERQARCNE